MRKNLYLEMMHRSTLTIGRALAAAMLFAALFCFDIYGQKVVDRTVATVSDGVKTELITYSDLRWQLAMQPGVELAPPAPEDLNRALQTLINIRIFVLEAERLPRAAPTEEEIRAEIDRVLALFPSTAEFERRLRAVGFSSVRDDNFERLMAQRVAIEKFQEFRFRSFIVITPEDEKKYFDEVYLPNLQRLNPGSILPGFEERRKEVVRELRIEREAVGIEAFLDEAKRRVEIVILAEQP